MRRTGDRDLRLGIRGGTVGRVLGMWATEEGSFHSDDGKGGRMNTILGILSLLAALAVVVVYAYQWGLRCGLKQGHEKGWKACADWCGEVERGVDRERAKTWRGEW